MDSTSSSSPTAERVPENWSSKRGKGLIRRWLPAWAGQKRAIVKYDEDDVPLASRLDAGSVDDTVSVLGDGMAAGILDVDKERTDDVMNEYDYSNDFKTEDLSGHESALDASDTFTAAAQEMERMGYFELDRSPSARRLRRRRNKTSRHDSKPAVIDCPAINPGHESLQLMRQRIMSGSKPGQRQDHFKLGLVVEGGGMRGCVSGGGLQALGDLGLQNVFDAVYGSSAGAINSTYFLSGQRDGVEIYYKHIASTEFIDLKRLINRKPGTPAALNLEFLLDHVIEKVLPLDFNAVLESAVPLKVVASSLDTLSPILLEDFESKRDLVECLRASANVPRVAGGPVSHRGHRLVDAAVFEAVPFRSAIADGCTHIVVLCTRPAPVRMSALDKALTDALQAAIKRAVLNPDYMVDAWRASVKHLVMDGLSNDDILLRGLDEGSHQLPWFAGTHVLPIYPSSHASSFSPLCTDVPTLLQGVGEGRRAVYTIAKSSFPDLVDFSKCKDLELINQSANIVPMKRSTTRQMT
jgi:predicted patatin/cPLA2 family phospholipase